ncbi:acyl-CoA dehydrogenase [Gordonia pseudamarae]|uniref:Acyl-CoA dehydrogenase n=1 Tax=Gordonia pseudamarae TaxID=2831662 RepID=A0ABX6IMR0_9ACTN|nr:MULTISPECIES: acyl-CoA dehydrogenase family protein [Gordonia]MBD0022205.1 acyl-CoA dehydrogenase [Gordonia sp. (in: high G+C Gram-positive bacteria)]QHN28220.1 acyl-CoA dehydrogenase [Gordonia pseudamarae]QHN37080.1 acyl-CoA dehydrogenase [Gordonia pseudamarae]
MTDIRAELRRTTTDIINRLGTRLETPAGTDTALWEALVDAGFTEIGVDEQDGDAGGTLADVLAVVAAVAGAGATIPLIEHTALAKWLAARAGIALDVTDAGGPTSTVTVAIGDDLRIEATDGITTVHGTAHEVVSGGARFVLVAVPDTADATTLALVDLGADGVTVSGGTDLVGTALADVDFADAAAIQTGRAPVSIDEVRTRGALAYAVALAAAAQRVRDITVAYAGQRVQFGRPLTKFQAIQQRLAQLAGTTALMTAAADAATREFDASGDERVVAAAKTVTSASARDIASAGHQIHGAIGFTAEHSLGRSTTSLWSWRDRFGNEQDWARVLARHILDDGVDVWDIIVGDSGSSGDVGATSPSRSGSDARHQEGTHA